MLRKKTINNYCNWNSSRNENITSWSPGLSTNSLWHHVPLRCTAPCCPISGATEHARREVMRRRPN